MLDLHGATVSYPSQEQIDAGANPELIVTLVTGLTLPIADPSDPSSPLVVPGARFRLRFDGEDAVTVGKQMIAGGETLPKRSRIPVASSLAEAEQVARAQGAMRAP